MNKIFQGIAAAAQCPITCNIDGTVEGRYSFAASFAGFDGHFPGHPILPAIVEIMTVVAMVGEHEGCRQRLVAIEDAKFLKPVTPDQEIVVHCRPRTVKGKLLHDAKLTVGDTVTASMLLELEPAGGLQ